MSDEPGGESAVERVYRAEGGRVLATLIGLLGDFDLAEEALQEALAVAVERWPVEGLPARPRAWLVSTARFKAIDRLRRAALDRRKRDELASEGTAAVTAPEVTLAEIEAGFPDERLRLLFTCCHPALAPEAQVALSLRTLCGLDSDEIARALLVPVPTLQQRLVRAKAKIRAARIPYRVPGEEELPERLEAVLRTIYLVFNEGYAPTAGARGVRADLCAEAIRLARLVVALLPARSEAIALLALMLLTDARRPARFDDAGELVLLEDQDRSRWERAKLRDGLALVEQALRLVEKALRAGRRPGAFALQAAIAGVHARAATASATNWREIGELYRLLEGVEPSPVVALNRAVAVAMIEGPAAGLARLDELVSEGRLAGYHLLPAARADLLRRLGRSAEAAACYRAALALARTEPERRFLQRRIAEVVEAAAGSSRARRPGSRSRTP